MTPRIPPMTTPVAGEGDDSDTMPINSLWYRYFQSLQQSIPGDGVQEAPEDGVIYGRQDAAWVKATPDLGYAAAATSGTVTNTVGDDATIPVFAAGAAGLVPGAINVNSGRFLREDGSWAGAAGGSLVEVYSTPGTFTWTKSAGAQFIRVFVVGGGGGGGSGGYGLAQLRSGGAGGGGAALVDFSANASDMPLSAAIVVGAGGAGGVGISTGILGNSGAIGASSSFGSIVTAYGGGGGGGGQNTGTGGGGGAGALSAGGTTTLGGTAGGLGGQYGGIQGGGVSAVARNSSWIGGAGGGGNQFASSSPGVGGMAYGGGQGGGQGGTVITLTPPTATSGGTASRYLLENSLPGGAPNTNAVGATGVAVSFRGAGGPGGGASATNAVPAGNGADGQQPGGGGGGGGAWGGAPIGAGTSGAGGAGGSGIVVVITSF